MLEFLKNMEENANVNATENDNLDAHNVDAENVNVRNVDNANDNGENIDIFDLTIWYSLESRMIGLLETKGPKRDLSIVNGPKYKSSRCFIDNLYTNVIEIDMVIQKSLIEYFIFVVKNLKEGLV